MLGAGDGGPPDEKPEEDWVAPPVTDSEPEVESPNSVFFLKGTGTDFYRVTFELSKRRERKLTNSETHLRF